MQSSVSPAILNAQSLKLIKDINASTQRLVDSLTVFGPANFNIKPRPDSWSAGDVSEHVLKLEILINDILRGPTGPAVRPQDEHVNLIGSVFSNFERGLSSPAVIQPSAHEKELWEMINQITWQRDRLKEVIATSDLSVVCLGFKHHFFGEMTPYEWAYFSIYHSDRHVKQLEQIHYTIG
jgi:hypothetical protein